MCFSDNRFDKWFVQTLFCSEALVSHVQKQMAANNQRESAVGSDQIQSKSVANVTSPESHSERKCCQHALSSVSVI